MPTKKSRVSPMLQTIDLKALPTKVLDAFLAYMNSVSNALELADLSKRYSEFLQGVTMGEKLAQNTIDYRESLKGGMFLSVEQVGMVPYLTEDKLRTLVGVFYVETGEWVYPTPQVQEPTPEVVLDEPIKPEPLKEGGTITREGTIIPSEGDIQTTKIAVRVYTQGGPAPTDLYCSVVRGTRVASVESWGQSKIKGVWNILFAATGDISTQPVWIRVDAFGTGRQFLFAVTYRLTLSGGELILKY